MFAVQVFQPEWDLLQNSCKFGRGETTLRSFPQHPHCDMPPPTHTFEKSKKEKDGWTVAIFGFYEAWVVSTIPGVYAYLQPRSSCC